MEESQIDVFNFDPIRPYNDEELKAAIERILEVPEFYKMLKWVFPGLSRAAIQKMLRQVTTVDEFQSEISGPAFKMAIQTTTSGLSFTNFESLDKTKPYLFLSNHRDIILDSAILNVSLLEQGHKTTQIAIGDNLLRQKVVEDIVRSNKNFIVNRNVNAKEMFYYSLRLSNYIRHTLTQDHTSIWIAQREGRAKDGFDRTDPALLKMLLLAYRDEESPISALLAQAQIVPVSVSYEVDPCGTKKAEELVAIARDGEYQKAEHEDLQSMILGLMGYKGRVHLSFARPIDNVGDVEQLTERLDKDIVSNYRTFPTHRYAAKTLAGSQDREDVSTDKALVALKADLAACGDDEKTNLLQQYANVWENRKALGID